MRATTSSPTDSATPSVARGGAFAFLRDAWHGIKLGRELRASSGLVRPSADLLAAINGGPTKSGASVSENTAFNMTAVRTCVSLRANLLASLPIKVYRKTATGPEEQRDHRLAAMFRGRVSPAHTKFKWVHCTSVSEDIGGNGYSRLLRDQYEELTRILWTKPAHVTPLWNENTGDIAFRVNGEQRDRLGHEMLHIAGLSTNGITGRSPISDLREPIGLSLTAEEFTARTFSNGNRKPGYFIPPVGWKKEQADQFREQWLAQGVGAVNAGKQHLIGGGMTWTEAGFSNEDAELLGTRKFSIEEVCRVYHVPLHLAGSTEKATTWGSGIEQLNQGLVDYMLRPRCENWEAEMKTILLTEREQEEGYYIKFVVDALLRGSPAGRAAYYQTMRAIRAMSANEIRSKEEMPEAPDTGANSLDWPMNNQGGGGQPTTQPAGQSTGDNLN